MLRRRREGATIGQGDAEQARPSFPKDAGAPSRPVGRPRQDRDPELGPFPHGARPARMQVLQGLVAGEAAFPCEHDGLPDAGVRDAVLGLGWRGEAGFEELGLLRKEVEP